MSSTHSSHNGATDSVDEDVTASESADRAPRGERDDVWPDLVARWSELREYAAYYLAANVDRLRLTGRAALMWSILGIVVGLIAVSIIVAASAALVMSLSTGVGQLLGGRIWLGQLVVSATILLSASGGVWLVLRRSLRRYHRALVTKYESRKQQERTEHGTDVEQRAKERAQNA